MHLYMQKGRPKSEAKMQAEQKELGGLLPLFKYFL